jgi:RNA polymerase sigma factor (sigma-70 family)
MATTPTRHRDRDELQPYFDAIRAHPPLSREEEHAVALRARAGDAAAKRKLAEHNLAFVVAVVRKQRRGTVRLDDLVQEGNVGLLRAVDKFDPHAGTRFSTYAVWWIRAYVGKYLREVRSSVRPQCGTVAQDDFSLDAPCADEGDVTHLERLEEAGPGPEARFLAAEADSDVRAALARLRRRLGELGWEIVHRRLEQDEPTTLEDLGRRWGVSRERVRQVELQAKRYLRRYLAEAMQRDAA